jgi:transaldolase/glucose-6-phosphate isomerase
MLKVTQELEEEGVQAFSSSFDSLVSTVSQRREGALRDIGPLVGSIPTRIARLEADSFINRLFSTDTSLWTDDPKGQAEISIRMGWLALPEAGVALLPEMEKFVSEIKEVGYTHALLLGMGGSSLAPEVMSLIFGDSVTV